MISRMCCGEGLRVYFSTFFVGTLDELDQELEQKILCNEPVFFLFISMLDKVESIDHVRRPELWNDGRKLLKIGN